MPLRRPFILLSDLFCIHFLKVILYLDKIGVSPSRFNYAIVFLRIISDLFLISLITTTPTGTGHTLHHPPSR